MSEKTTKTDPSGREGLPCKLASTLAARRADPTPTVTRSSDDSRSEMTTSMVVRSQSRGGRSFAAVPEMETRPEIASLPEPDVEI